MHGRSQFHAKLHSKHEMILHCDPEYEVYFHFIQK